MILLEELSQIVGAAFTEIGLSASLGVVMYSDRPELGQLQVNGALAGSKILSLPPREIAQKIINILTQKGIFSKLSIAGPGFINLTLTSEYLVSYLQKITYSNCPEPKKIIVDFGGPNVAKPLHVGHLRSSIIGESLRRINLFLGHEVTGDIHLGDWGTQMGMVITEIKREQPELPYFDTKLTGPYPTESPITISELERLYPQASNRAKSDESARAEAVQATKELQEGRPGYRALWQHFVDISIKEIKQDMDWLKVHYDLWDGESHYQERIPGLISRLNAEGFTEQSQGATIIPLPGTDTEKELIPLLLTKSDGSSLYATTDLATLEERIADGRVDMILYVVDQRQKLHFQQVFRVARLTEIAPQSVDLQFLGFGTVNGPDGKPFKTRDGGVMKLRELIDLTLEKAREKMQEAGIAKDYPPEEQDEITKKVALAALKFADLSNNRSSDYNFNLEKFTNFEGKTGPYVIYTAVRICSIFRKLNNPTTNPVDLLSATKLEEDLYVELTKLPGVITITAEQSTPHILAEQVFSLAQTFNRFYQQCNISKETDLKKQASWLALSKLTYDQLELGLHLLGISIPERM